jgi:hypothetical protein
VSVLWHIMLNMAEGRGLSDLRPSDNTRPTLQDPRGTMRRRPSSSSSSSMTSTRMAMAMATTTTAMAMIKAMAGSTTMAVTGEEGLQTGIIRRKTTTILARTDLEGGADRCPGNEEPQ